MSQIGCACGHVIRDQTDSLPYKASLLCDEDEDRFWGGLSRDLADLVAAVREGKRESWIAKHFLDGYPRDLSHENLISDFLNEYALRFMRTLYQCEQCGRLLVEERSDPNRFRFFVPERDATPNALRALEGPPS